MSKFHFEDGMTMEHVRTNIIHGISNKLDVLEANDEALGARIDAIGDAGGVACTAATIEALIDNTKGNVDSTVQGGKLVLTADVQGSGSTEVTAEDIAALVDNGAGNVDAVATGGKLVLTAEGGSGGATTFLSLTDTPTEYGEGGYLRVNEAGTGIEFHNPNEGDEQAYISSTQVYGEFYIPGTAVGGGEVGRTNLCSKSTYTMFSSNVDYMVLPEITSTDTVPIDGQVRSGRVLNFVTFNAPATIKKPVASTGQRIYANGGLVDELALATGENVQMYAMYNGSKFKHWIAVGGRYSLPEVTDPLPEDDMIQMA